MTGFGPFIEKTTVDFDQFRDDGIFVISGPTGAGKSSILDAVTFALYGWVPRYAAQGTRGSVRNRALDLSEIPTEVTVEISHGDRRYRILRRPEWTKPGNKTATPQYAEIVQIIDGQENVEVARRIREVAEKVFEVVKLDATQFSQVVLLAQGEFQKFLVASSEDRKAVLRRLFSTRRFEDWSDEVSRRAKDLSADLATAHTQIHTLLRTVATNTGFEVPVELDDAAASEIDDWLTVLGQQIEDGFQAAKEAAQKAGDDAEKAHSELEKLKNLRARQEQRAEAMKLADELSAKDTEIDRSRSELLTAHRAAMAMPIVRDLQSAKKAKAESDTALSNARNALADFGIEPAIDDDVLQKSIDEAIAQTAKLSALIGTEEELELLESQKQTAIAAEQIATDQIETTKTDIEALEERLREITTQIAGHRPAAEMRAETERQIERLTAKLDAAKQVEQLQTDWREAADRQHQHHQQLLEFETGLADLQRRRLVENAGYLAQELAPGKPCQVCGSTEHPQPAALLEDAVSDSQLAEMRERVQTARERDVELSTVETGVKTRLDAAVIAADGGDVDGLTELLAAARLDHDKAHTAHNEMLKLEDEREKIGVQVTDLRTALAEREKTAVNAKLETSRLTNKTQELTKELTVARGEYPTIRAHHAAATKRLDLLRADLAARQRLVATIETEKKAANKLETACAEHDFADADDVLAAHRSATQIADLEKLVRDHDAEKARLAGVLAQASLQDLPTELVDLTETETAYAAAKHALDEAHALLGSQRSLIDAFRKQAEQIEKLQSQNAKTQERYDVLKRLADTMNGQGPNEKKMSLESYVLAGDLEDIIDAANQLLRDMTNSRFQLELDDSRAGHGAQSGLGLHIHDAWNDERRPPESLSGGEKFQASLALALGLAEVVTSRSGGVRLDTLFIDEGFGSLDDETLDEVLGTIDGLRRNGRTVGLISHVAAVKERIAGHIEVSTSEQAGSSIRIRQP